MPTYEYECQDCGHRVDYFQSMKESPRTECPRCNGKLSRLVSTGAGLIFKGSGFYETDYKKKSSKPSSSNSEASKPTSEGKDAKKPEPKKKEATTSD